VTDHREINNQGLIKALAHPLRVQILGVLEQGRASPVELARELDAPLANVAYHVRELQRYDMIKLVKKTQRRGAIEHYYEVTERPRITDAGWAAAPKAVKGAMVRAALEQISTFVNAAAIEGGFDREEAHLNRVQLTVDERGWKELSKELWRVLEALPRIEEASRKRLASNNHEGEQNVTVVTLGFETAEPMIARPRKAAAAKKRATRQKQA
jgi:DNA-binding transcriptional ArsR family regulator